MAANTCVSPKPAPPPVNQAMMTTAALLAAALLLLQAGAARASSADCAVPGCLACATDAAGKDDPTRCDTCDRQLGYFTIAAVDGTCTCNADGGFGLADPADPAQGCACNQPGFAMDAAQKYCVPLCQLAVPGCTTCADGDASACSACDTMAGYAQDAVDGGCTCDASAGYAPADADDPSKGCACTQPGWRTDADGWCVEGKPGEPPCADCEPSNDSKPVHQPPKPRHHGRPGETRCQRRFPGCARCDKLAKRCLRWCVPRGGGARSAAAPPCPPAFLRALPTAALPLAPSLPTPQRRGPSPDRRPLRAPPSPPSPRQASTQDLQARRPPLRRLQQAPPAAVRRLQARLPV